jgi:hypothetical protein
MKYSYKEAMQILGVVEGSTKHDVEVRYDILMKKYKLLKSEGNLDEKSEADFEKITEAYRILMGYEIDEPKIETKETYTDKAFKKAGLDKKKADNFFYYHKFHILIAIVALIAIVLTVKSFVDRVDPDITVGFIGEVNVQEYDTLKAKIKENIPEIKAIDFDSAYITQNSKEAQQEAANLSKALVLLSVSDTDMFLMNKYTYQNYAPSGPFMNMESLVKDLKIDTSKSDYLKLKVVDEWDKPNAEQKERKVLKYKDAEPHLYGIDVTNSKFFKGINIIGPEKILVIKQNPKKMDLVLKLVRLFSE